MAKRSQHILPVWRPAVLARGCRAALPATYVLQQTQAMGGGFCEEYPIGTHDLLMLIAKFTGIGCEGGKTWVGIGASPDACRETGAQIGERRARIGSRRVRPLYQ